jgi:hypothetical protein
MKFSRTFLILVALAFAGCAQYASVSETRPQFRPVRAVGSALVSVEQRIVSTLRREKRKPLAALGELLTAAESASQQLARKRTESAARDAYNFAVARVIGTIKQAKLDPWTQPVRVGEFVLTYTPDPRPQWNPALYDFTPADEFDMKGTYVTERERKEGVGAPTVATGRGMNENAEKDFSIPKIYYGITVPIPFEGRRTVVVFEDRSPPSVSSSAVAVSRWPPISLCRSL